MITKKQLLAHEILKAYIKFERKHKKKPVYIVLGSKEYQTLRSESESPKLFDAGVWNKEEIVLRIEQIPDLKGFSLEESLDY